MASAISVGGHTRIYGIIGNPVHHSFSPLMQSKAFAATEIDAVYLPFQIEEKDLPRLLDSFRILKIQGFNVTVPYKEKIIEYLDELSDEAKALASVNTVVFREGGWWGTSTDGEGFVRSLKEENIEIKDKRFCLLGAGGSAKAIGFALVQSEVAELDLFNRTTDKANLLMERLKQTHPKLKIRVNPNPAANYHLLINSTSVGMDAKSNPASEELISNSDAVADIIYNPAETPLLQIAKTMNKPHLNGLGMLLHQGAAAFEIWTGQPAPLDIMQRSLLDSLKS